MKVLGRKLVDPFNEFWEDFRDDIHVPVEHIEEAHSSVFEDQGADVTAPEMPAWASVPDDDLAHHVAHQLTHMAMRNRGYPHTTRGRDFAGDSAEARVGGDLQEMVLHASLEVLMKPYGFRQDFIRTRMLNGALNGVASAPIPEHGTPWFVTWAIRYSELQMDLAPFDWARLKSIYESRSEPVCELGEELYGIMAEVGCGTRERALEALVRTRDTLALGIEGRVMILDPTTDKLY